MGDSKRNSPWKFVAIGFAVFLVCVLVLNLMTMLVRGIRPDGAENFGSPDISAQGGFVPVELSEGEKAEFERTTIKTMEAEIARLSAKHSAYGSKVMRWEYLGANKVVFLTHKIGTGSVGESDFFEIGENGGCYRFDGGVIVGENEPGYSYYWHAWPMVNFIRFLFANSKLVDSGPFDISDFQVIAEGEVVGHAVSKSSGVRYRFRTKDYMPDIELTAK